MIKLIVKKKGYFTTNNPFLKIYDFRKILFYSYKFVAKFKKRFYLPIGVYYITASINRIKYKPRKIKKLPKFERNLKHNWSDFKIGFKENPNKATIYHKKKLIIFDNIFKTKPLYILIFILGHEVGHKYYKTEYKADAYAVNYMLKAGFNRSQIGLAPLSALTDEQLKRKHIIIKNLKS